MSAAAHRGGSWFLAGLSVFVLLGCNRQVPMDDPSVKPFADMFVVDRAQYGFSPLPRNAKVHIEEDPKCYMDCGYDAMLQVYGKPSHYVSFKKENGTYKWIGEQEVCSGPRQYHTVNGWFNETLVITYTAGHEAGKLDGLHISYRTPEDPMGLQQISVGAAKRILKALGCE